MGCWGRHSAREAKLQALEVATRASVAGCQAAGDMELSKDKRTGKIHTAASYVVGHALTVDGGLTIA